MNFSLTESQKALARTLVEAVTAGKIGESFYIVAEFGGKLHVANPSGGEYVKLNGTAGGLDVLAEASLIVQQIIHGPADAGRTCTLTGAIYSAVKGDFKDEARTLPVSSLAHPAPPEISIALDRLRAKYPDPQKLGFLIMRFTAAKPFERIVAAIRATFEKHGLVTIRADENEFHADLWGNVRTILHGCGFGIAVYERIETDEPNANVGLEVGYLMAMNKPVLLLKDKTVPALQSDLAGRLYKSFDPHDPEGTLPDQLTKWLEDNGIVVPARS